MTLQHAEHARSPVEISLRGWAEVGLAATVSRAKHRSPAAAAGVAFYALLAFFPGVAALGSFLGLAGRPEGVERKLRFIADLVPADVFTVIAGEAPRFAQAEPGKLLSAGLIFAGLCVLSASSAVRQLMVALNVAYRRPESRSWVRRRLIATAFAAGITAAIAGEIGLLAKTGSLHASGAGGGEVAEVATKWAMTVLISLVSLTLLYRYAPDRRLARWRWITPGSLFAALAGVGTSLGASLYLTQVARYSHTYGGLGVLLGLAVWLWSAMMVVLAGAEVNYALECQTSAQTCEEPKAPLGAGAEA